LRRLSRVLFEAIKLLTVYRLLLNLAV